jgi:hypothetical protein
MLRQVYAHSAASTQPETTPINFVVKKGTNVLVANPTYEKTN